MKDGETDIDARWREHKAGWIVLRGGEVAVELEFYANFGPYQLFRAKGGVISAAAQEVFRWDFPRVPDPTIVFRHRSNPGVIVADGFFQTRLTEDGLVELIDQRRPPPHPQRPGMINAMVRRISSVSDSLGRRFGASSDSDPHSPPATFESCVDHRAGWLVEKEGRVVAEILYFYGDWPWRFFRPKGACEISPEGRAAVRSSARRDPDPSIVFRSRADPNTVVADKYFFTSLSDGDFVGIRDLRPR